MGIYTKLLNESKIKLSKYLSDLEDEERHANGYKPSDLQELRDDIDETKRLINQNKKKDSKK